MKYSVKNIAEIIAGDFIYKNATNSIVEHLLIDSRKIIYPETSIFITIKGVQNDGHNYLQDAYDAGVRNFIVEKSNFKSETFKKTDISVVSVASGLDALQKIAAYHRLQFTFPVIGIAGSNGKTIVKEWLFQLLKDEIEIVRSPKSYNSKVGVPLSVWQINDQHQVGIFEAGISMKEEMSRLQKIIKPDIGIFTFFGQAHNEGFKNNEEKLAEKLKLFKNSKLLIYCSDQKIVEDGIKALLKKSNQLKTFSWSRKNKSANILIQVKSVKSRTTLSIVKTNFTVEIPFTDEASIWNSCTCIAYFSSMGLLDSKLDVWKKRFAELHAIEMRLQLREGINNCMLINDSYNSDINSLQIALDFMSQQSAGYAKKLILSDIYQSGLKSKELYLQVAKIIQQKKIQKFIGIGEKLFKNKSLFNPDSKFFMTTDEFLKQLTPLSFRDEIILLKGSRQFQLENISKVLERRIHETVFEINLDALTNNLNVYRSKLKPGVKLMAMVKAFSYGTGSYEIAKVLEFNRVDYLAVAYADEGVTLRNAGIKTPIMVMNPNVAGFDSILKYNLEPEIYNLKILDELIAAADGEEVSIHIEIDSGMKRLGFDEVQIDKLIKKLKSNPSIHVKSVLSHLAASEAKEHDSFTLQQIKKFETLSSKICSAFEYKILRHCLNSAAIARFQKSQYDMVRLGIGLYGIDPAAKFQKQLQQIGTLKTVISQIRNILSSESIGYGRKGKVKRLSRVAIVAIGYADGIDRKFGNGKGFVMIQGKPAKIIGNICMDMTMVDVTAIDCKEGDDVIVFGNNPTVIELSKKIDTIPYEILTGISQRVKRVYFYE